MGKISMDFMCHYFSTLDGDIHRVDVKPCVNCEIPVCSSCRDEDGYCLECARLRGNETALACRAEEMERYYDKAKRFLK
jgi:hypothetical protein